MTPPTSPDLAAVKREARQLRERLAKAEGRRRELMAERTRVVMTLRALGVEQTEIGSLFGIGVDRVKQLVRQAGNGAEP